MKLRGECPPPGAEVARIVPPSVRASPGRDACYVCGHATTLLRVLCGCCLDRLSFDDAQELFDLWDSGCDWTVYNARALEMAATLGPCPRCSVCGLDVRLHFERFGTSGEQRVVTHSRAPMRAVCKGSGQPPLAEGAKTLLEQVEP